jgi:putative DNA primase/helicase
MTNQSNGYLFNPVLCLWQKVEAYQVYNHILPYFKEIFSTLTDKTSKEALKCKAKIEGDNMRRTFASSLTSYCLDVLFEEKLDRHPSLLPIKDNKVIDLMTGEIRTRTILDFFTFESPVSKTDSTLNAESFFLSISNGDTNLSIYLQTLLLYFLSGLTFDRSFYQFIGPSGMNGKSTFINIIEKILNCTCVVGEKKAIIKDPRHPSRNEGANPFLLASEGKKVMTFTETEQNEQLNSSSLKILTGGDRISCRALFSNDIKSFVPTAKILICSNYPLEFHNNDTAVKARAKYIPFNHVFDRNENFKHDLLSNKFGLLSEIFTLAVMTGSRSLQLENIILPESVIKQTEEMFQEMDLLQQFINEECDIGLDLYVPSKDFIASYSMWCATHSHEKNSLKWLYKQLDGKGFIKKKKKIENNLFYAFFGLKMKESSRCL